MPSTMQASEQKIKFTLQLCQYFQKEMVPVSGGRVVISSSVGTMLTSIVVVSTSSVSSIPASISGFSVKNTLFTILIR